MTIHGHWNHHESKLHINLLEMKAIYFALLAFRDISNHSILVRTDNTTCVAYINHQGGTTSPILSKDAETLWELCLNRNIHLRAEHVPGIMNVLADRASRLTSDRHDWKLNPTIFQQLNPIWGPFQIDLFANRTNTQLPRFYSWTPDPFAEATDAFLQSWNKQNLWANPPWILIPQILSKTIHEKATLTILVPLWESAPWFPTLLNLLIAPPIVISTEHIVHPIDNQRHYPLRNPQWSLFACKISGHGMKQRVFQKKLSTFSYPHWIQTLHARCPLIFGNGFLGANSTRLIPLLAL